MNRVATEATQRKLGAHINSTVTGNWNQNCKMVISSGTNYSNKTEIKFLSLSTAIPLYASLDTGSCINFLKYATKNKYLCVPIVLHTIFFSKNDH